MHCRLAGTLRRPLGDIMDGRPMSFDEFRKRALESMEGAARRWEDPDADSSMQVMLGQDHYGDFHVIPIPPGYVELERGHVFWLKSSLPAEVINRSLRCLAFRASMWTSSREEYRDQPVRDPERGEAMMVCISDGKRLELWHAPITRSKSAVPALADWDHLTQLDAEFSGAIPKLMRDALNQPEVRMGPLPRVIPAANLVLSAYDVPPEFAPAVRLCGHVPAVAEEATATYRAIFNTTKPGPVIGSTVYVFLRITTSRASCRGACRHSANSRKSSRLRRWAGSAISSRASWGRMISANSPSSGDTLAFFPRRYWEQWRGPTALPT